MGQTNRESFLSRHLPPWLSKNAFLLSLTSLLNDISSEMIFPILPIFITQVLGAPPAILGLMEGVANGIELSLRGISGVMSDRLARRRPLVSIGYAFSAVTKPLFAIATTWSAAVFIRAADRAGKGIRVTPRDALLAADSAGPHLGRVTGFRKAADNFGAVLGPLLCAGLLALFATWGLNQSESFRLIFFLSVFPALLGLAMVMGVKEPNRIPKAPSLRSVLLPPPGSWRNFLLLSALFSLGTVSWAFFVLRASDAGISNIIIPLLYVLANFIAMLSSTHAGELADKLGGKTLLGLSFALFGLVCFSFANSSEPFSLGLSFVFYGLFLGSYETSVRVYVATHFPNEQMGSRLGAYYWVTAICALPAGIIAGVLYPMQWHGWPLAFVWGMSISLISAVALVLSRHKHNPTRP